jgi:hypothetical protein
MTKFNLREAIAKNKATFFSSLNENASDTAEKFAKHMSKKENRKFTVTPGSVDEKSFDLDIDGLEYEGGSYLIDDNGDIINVSMGNKVYGNVNQLEEGDLMKSVGKGLDYEATEKMIRNYAGRLLSNLEDNTNQFRDVEDLFDFYLVNPQDFPEPMNYEFFKNNFDDILSLAMTGLDEGKKSWYMEPEEEDYNGEDYGDYNDENMGDGYIDDTDSEYDTGVDESKKKYYKDAEADDAEHIKALEKDMKDDKKSSKMKKSELKAKIKEMVLAEMNLDIQDTTSEYDFLAEKTVKEGVWSVLPARIPEFIQAVEELKDEYHAVVGSDDVYDGLDRAISAAEELLMNTAKIREAKEEEVEDTEVDIDGMEDIDVDTTSEVDPDIKAVQDLLTQAQAAAQALGDEKLTDQIGNTITFFTRTHVVDKGAVAEGKEMEEGYFGANNEVEELIDALEYETMDEFFSDNPGAITAVLDWAAGIPEFRAKMETSGLLEAKKSTAKLDEIVKDMDHIISFMYLYIDNFFKKNDDRSEDELEVIDDIKYDLEGRKQNVIMKKYKDINSVKDLERYVATNLGKINDEDELDESLNESMFPMLKKILK